MFAIVEFNNKKKEFYVIPMLWLSDDKKKCFWPKNVTDEEELETMILELTPPKTTWNCYSIKKIHDAGAVFSDLNDKFKEILEQRSSTSDNRDDGIPPPSAKEVIDNDRDKNFEEEGNENRCDIDNGTKKRTFVDQTSSGSEAESEENGISKLAKSKKLRQKKKKSKSFKTVDLEETISSSDSNDEEPLQKKGQLRKLGTTRGFHPTLLHSQRNKNSEDTDLPPRQTSGNNTPIRDVTPTSFRQTNTSSLYPSQVFSNQLWQESVIKDLETVKLVQSQHSTLLAQIYQAVQTKNIQALQRPEDIPELPIADKKSLRVFEQWLGIKTNYIYMRSRVAAVGGTSVRTATMNMLKFLLTNKLAMRFNWAGSAPKAQDGAQKYAFKDIKTCELLLDAVKLCFTGRDTTELNDLAIRGAIQDWLKLAKSRFNYNNV